HVAVPANMKRRVGMDFEFSDHIKSEMQELILDHSSTAINKRIVDLEIPATVTIMAVKRNDVFIAPRGSTKLLENDILYILAEDKAALDSLAENLGVSF
ncbi:MAG: TrkA C-terminal domain-containing protein, partial [Flavitalea sp.]